jgi:site-specific DNA-methyltransferase (adenine-specific)
MLDPVKIGNATLYLGDCLAVMRILPDNSVDSIVTDPPYGLNFMGKKWDYDVPSVEVWAECLRVLKPGGHLLAFAGTRTQHRMAVRIEDAGFEIRDMIAWVYGSGFPKSLDVSKAIDKASGAEPIDLGMSPNWRESKRDREKNGSMEVRGENAGRITAPATPEAQQWSGWGTALKPALEPITVARKPLGSTVAECVLGHGTGGINVDGCRVGTTETWSYNADKNGTTFHGDQGERIKQSAAAKGATTVDSNPLGRWPANLIHDGSEEVLAGFPQTKSGALNAGHKQGAGSFGKIGGATILRDYGDDSGSASRFFYTAKASKSERGEGNIHPTVKPLALMRYLCRLITPPSGIVLDPFMGSGSTGKAALTEVFAFIGIERDAAYFDIACKRIEQAVAQGQLFEPEPAKQVQEALL